MNWPGATNRGTALLRYLHQQDGPRLYRDDYVRWFVDESTAGEPPGPFDASDSAGDQMASIAYCFGALRERYFDELIERSVGNGVAQLLLLGAGFDTRCLRLEALRSTGVRVVEVDLPDAIAEKMEILTHHLGKLPENLFPVGMDLAGEELTTLFDRGLERRLRTVCIWQGVSYYLSFDSVSRVLDFLASDLPAGTVVGFDACSPAMLDEDAPLPAIRYNIERTKAIGEPYRFAMTVEAMRDSLADRGFRDVVIAAQEELERRYLHRSLLPGGMWYVVSAIT